MNDPRLDPVSVATILAAAFLGPQLAGVVGPYTVIVLASITGAAWSLGRRTPTTRMGAAWYFTRLAATAVLLSVAIEAIVGTCWPALAGSHWLLAPIALLVGGIGEDWPTVGQWVLARIRQLIERRTGGTE